MKSILATLLLVCCLPAWPGWAQTASKPKTVPATYAPKTDTLSFQWDINQQGAIGQGTNGCFSNAFQMEVNGNSFSAAQAVMTPDGSEYTLSGNFNGVEVTRRIKVDAKNSLVRYVDTFNNVSGAPLQTTAQINIQFNNRMQTIVSDLGTPGGGALAQKESGLLAIRGNNQQQPSVILYLAGAAAKVKPTIRNNGNYRLDLSYALSLAPGETVSFLHGVAQRTVAGLPDPKALTAMFAPFRSARFVSDLSGKERKTILNLGDGSAGMSLGGLEIPVLASPLERLNVERGAADVLAIGEETRLKGSASCAALSVQSQYGPVQVPFEKVAAISGGTRQGCVYLRDGQALSGRITVQDLKFTLPSGTTMSLNTEGLDRLVLRTRGGQDGDIAADSWGWVETHGGDRLAMQADPAFRLHTITPWGTREIPLDELVCVTPTEENALGYRVILKDGSRFFALLDGDDLTVKTRLFGERKVPVGDLRAVVTAQARVQPEEETDRPAKAQVVLAGDQLLSGRIDLAELHFVTPGDVVPIVPATIKSLRNTADDKNSNAGFIAETWGSGVIAGALRETVLPVRTGDSVQMVPTQDVLEATLPAPAVSENMRDKIATLIRDLGHPEWEKREAASRELGELGPMARQQLAEAVKQTPDAEVRRRAQTLLDENQ